MLFWSLITPLKFHYYKCDTQVDCPAILRKIGLTSSLIVTSCGYQNQSDFVLQSIIDMEKTFAPFTASHL